jgi:hypothetical protein
MFIDFLLHSTILYNIENSRIFVNILISQSFGYGGEMYKKRTISWNLCCTKFGEITQKLCPKRAEIKF